MRIKWFCLLISLLSTAAHAVVVDLVMRPGISASAEYLIGERSKPAVLVLHGFLQTREFRTVAALANSLRDAGYTVLAPTLSLNVPNRTQTLACEAVHKHSMDEDVAEIARWVTWLKSRGHHNIVLVGHSFGSLQLLAYLNAQPDAAIKAYIGASLIETRIAPIPRATLVTQLKGQVQRNQRALVTQTVSFCKKYTAPPEDLLSYVLWDQSRTLMAVKQSPVPIRLIMGDADKMVGHNWIKALQQIQAPLTLVHGANHFMDAEHEFDLLEHTLDFLQKVPLTP